MMRKRSGLTLALSLACLPACAGRGGSEDGGASDGGTSTTGGGGTGDDGGTSEDGETGADGVSSGSGTSNTATTSGALDASDPACFDDTPTTLEPLPEGYEPEAKDWEPGTPLVIDLELCEPGRYFTWLPLGSAWVTVRPGDDLCEVWLGGETENPLYDGSATQYCRFLRAACEAHVIVEASGGGPAWIESAGCIPPGA